MADAPDTIDPKNLPPGATTTPVKDAVTGADTGRVDIHYMGYLYNYKGQKVALESDLQNAVNNANLFSKLFGIDPVTFSNLVQRSGIILLGTALAIVGFAMFISGTKTAELVAELTPVGKLVK